jgi:quinol monooxygenase YgiN
MEEASLYIFARFHAQKGRAQEVSEALREEIPLARAETGCISISAFHATRYLRLFFIHSC